MGVRIDVVHLGLTSYREAWQQQLNYHARCRKTGENILLLTEHLPVITLGYRRSWEQLLSIATLDQCGIPIVTTERGGGATYHAPGQLVAYPLFSSLFRSCGVKSFVSCLETIMIHVSKQVEVQAVRRPGFPGVWMGKQKLGAVGIAVRRGVSLHGFALNVNIDLRPFSYIIPCGLRDAGTTSLCHERGEHIPMGNVVEQTLRAFAEVFHCPVKERNKE